MFVLISCSSLPIVYDYGSISYILVICFAVPSEPYVIKDVHLFLFVAIMHWHML